MFTEIDPDEVLMLSLILYPFVYGNPRLTSTVRPSVGATLN